MTAGTYRTRLQARLLLAHAKRARAGRDRNPPPVPKRTTDLTTRPPPT